MPLNTSSRRCSSGACWVFCEEPNRQDLTDGSSKDAADVAASSEVQSLRLRSKASCTRLTTLSGKLAR